MTDARAAQSPRRSYDADPGTLVVAVEYDGATGATVTFDGEMDLATAGSVAAALHSRLTEGRRFVRVDVSGVTFMDAGGLAVLLEAHHAFRAARGTLTLVGVGPRVARLLRITGLDRILLLDGGGGPAG